MNHTRSLCTRVLAAALALAGTAVFSLPVSAANLRVLTFAKKARFVFSGDPTKGGGVVSVGPDAELATVFDPSCPTTSSVEIEAYLQSTWRDQVLAHVDLDCAKWKPTKSGFRYTDPTGTIRSIRYGTKGLRIKIRGAGYTQISDLVGFVQAQLQVGDELLRARFHNFVKNDGLAVISRKPSPAAAAGERMFWAVLLGDDDAEASQQALLATLESAVARDGRDGRSYFLLGMTHLYRFGQRVTRIDDASAEARAELVAANAAFAVAVPLLWDDANSRGDSRVPGFAAGAKYLQGHIDGDAQMRADGLTELQHAVQINGFFNVFDYITILQALPPGDPVFQQAYAAITAYVEDPETFTCLTDQPEMCANAGFAPRNTQGSLTLFGDVYAKAGNLSQAQFFYGLVGAFPDTPTWPFLSVIQDRTVDPAARVALYADPDPSNDPPLIGAAGEACAVCHNR